jgi:hypothetical protein
MERLLVAARPIALLRRSKLSIFFEGPKGGRLKQPTGGQVIPLALWRYSKVQNGDESDIPFGICPLSVFKSDPSLLRQNHLPEKYLATRFEPDHVNA